VFAGRLGSDIKQGVINKTLVMPYSIILDAAVKEQAWKVVSLVLSLPILFGAWYWGREYINLDLGWTEVGLLVGTIVLGALIFALMEAVVGTMAFWFVETWPISETVGVARMLFGGVLAPLTLLPTVIQQASAVLPFQYMFYPAVSILTGIAGNPGRVILIQAGYVAGLYLLLRFTWSRGLRRYEGTGG
jgi:ABC-2 type transport system permease protein